MQIMQMQAEVERDGMHVWAKACPRCVWAWTLPLNVRVQQKVATLADYGSVDILKLGLAVIKRYLQSFPISCQVWIMD